jgi:hypothetical protein
MLCKSREDQMTHDELLKLILDSEIRSNEVGQGGWQALRAIVELHKPIQISNEQLCNACEEWTNEGQKQLFYPCPTIQAIEKELG